MKSTPWSTNYFSVLEGLGEDMDAFNQHPTQPKTEAVPPSPLLVRSTPSRTSTFLELRVRPSTGRVIAAKALLDSGASNLFADEEWVHIQGLPTRKLKHPVPVYNIDGTRNEAGSVREAVDLFTDYEGHTEMATFYVTALGGVALIVGHPWLSRHNPEIDWRKGKVDLTRCPPECGKWRKGKEGDCRRTDKRSRALRREKGSTGKRSAPGPDPPLVPEEPQGPKVTAGVSGDRLRTIQRGRLEPEPLDNPEASPECTLKEGDRIWVVYLQPEGEHVHATGTPSQRLAQEAYRAAPMSTIPKEFQQYAEVFTKETFDKLPEHRKWDHGIELKEGSEPYSSKIYPLSPTEQAELDKFLEENLASGRIRPSKSPMAAPFFFVKKKEGTLRPVQDYRKLNAMTVKNAYPLPLIAEVIEKARNARWFSKLDIRWGYNNVRIKPGDEWKAAFRTNRGLFEPLVMFFGLCNSPATFQTMMNELFRDLINRGVVCIYMDDILVLTFTKEEHSMVLHEVFKILQSNRLAVKESKCELFKM